MKNLQWRHARELTGGAVSDHRDHIRLGQSGRRSQQRGPKGDVTRQAEPSQFDVDEVGCLAPAYRYAGPHAGGPADALIPAGLPQPVRHLSRDPADAYAGAHAGGPADALIAQTGPVLPVAHNFACPGSEKSAAGACVQTCPSGIEDRGHVCLFRSESH